MPGELKSNQRALAEVLDGRFRETLVRIAARVVYPHSVAEDVVHDVILATLSEGSRFADVEDPQAYLRVSVRRRARARLRAVHRLAFASREIDRSNASDPMPLADARYLIDEEIVAALPSHLRSVFDCRLTHMTGEEIAAKLLVSPSTVKRCLSEIKVLVNELLRAAKT